MDWDRVRTRLDGMLTEDARVFAAGDGAFGGSTIVEAMYQGHRAAYYMKAYLEGNDKPLSYRTPYRTRRVPICDDPAWELNPRVDQKFHGLGEIPIEFPEIESTYTADEARFEAARCFRCDAETGSADYTVTSRESIFAMSRITPKDVELEASILQGRLENRDNPFGEEHEATLDDLVFLPANLSRLVIDPYREDCKTATDLGAINSLRLDIPFAVTGLDHAPDEIREAYGSIERAPAWWRRRLGEDFFHEAHCCSMQRAFDDDTLTNLKWLPKLKTLILNDVPVTDNNLATLPDVWQTPEVLDRPADQGRDLIGIAHVRLDEERVAALVRDLLGRRLTALHLHVRRPLTRRQLEALDRTGRGQELGL